MFFKLCAGILSSLAVITGIAFAVPESREFMLNNLAPYSEVYVQQTDKTIQLEETYNTNLATLNQAREALSNAERLSLGYQTQLATAQSQLVTVNANLSNVTNELNVLRSDYEDVSNELEIAQTNLDNANMRANQLSINLSNLNMQYINLQDEYNHLLMTGSQEEIDRLNMQIAEMYMQIENLNMQLNDAWMERDMYQSQVMDWQIERDHYQMNIMDLEMEIDMLHHDIMMRDEDCMWLQMEIDRLTNESIIINDECMRLQMEIDRLNEEIIRLNDISIELEDGSIVFEREVDELLCPMYSNGILSTFRSIIDEFSTPSSGNTLQTSYIPQLVEDTIMINERLADNDTQIRIGSYSNYTVVIDSYATRVRINYIEYFFAPDITMNTVYYLNGLEMSSEDLISNIGRNANYTFDKTYDYVLDAESYITNLTCYFRVTEV